MFPLFLAVHLAAPIQPPEPDRTGTELCMEVAHELNLSVLDGLLTQDKANGIIARCYRTFG